MAQGLWYIFKGKMKKLGRPLLIALLLVPGLGLSAQSASSYDFFRWLAGEATADPHSGLLAFTSLLVPMGGRMEGMGTAFSAVADDSSYLESNPAASSIQNITEFTIFHDNFIGDTMVDGLVYTYREGDLGIGLGIKALYLPFTEKDSFGVPVSKSYYTELSGTANLSYNFFSTFDYFGMAAGASLKLGWRSMPDYYDDTDPARPLVSGLSQSTLGLMADFGLLTRFNLLKFYTARAKNFSVSLVLRNVGVTTLGEPLPTTFSAGFSWSPVKPLILAFDFNLPWNLFAPASSEQPFGAVGLSLAFTDFLKMQAGVLIQASKPRISMGASFDFAGLGVVVNYSLDFLSVSTPLNRVSFQFRIALGDEGRLEKRQLVEELYFLGLDERTKGNLEAAIAIFKKVLELDPGFTPAAESLDSAQKALDLRKSIESVGAIE